MTDSRVWLIKKNCSASPRQLAIVFGSVVAVSSVIGIAFAVLGLWMVLPFVGLELAAVALAFLCYGRHAADFERIELRSDRLVVARQDGTQTSEEAFSLPGVRVEVIRRGIEVAARVRVELVSAQQRVEVGRDLMDGGRAALGRDLREALAVAAQRSLRTIEAGEANRQWL